MFALRVCVIVAVFEGYLMDVLVSMAIIAMNVLMDDVVVLVAGVGVIVDLITMGVLMVVGPFVCVFCRHVLTSSIALYCGIGCRREGRADPAVPQTTGSHMIYVTQCLIEQRRHMRVKEPVDHLAPTSISDHETKVSKDAQLMGNGRLLHLQFDAEVAHRTLTQTQPSQNSYPGCRRKRTHESSHFLGSCLRHGDRHVGVVGLTHVVMLTCAYLHGNIENCH